MEVRSDLRRTVPVLVIRAMNRNDPMPTENRPGCEEAQIGVLPQYKVGAYLGEKMPSEKSTESSGLRVFCRGRSSAMLDGAYAGRRRIG
jgi:hypothetical protein